jgi:hypothetical protein
MPRKASTTEAETTTVAETNGKDKVLTFTAVAIAPEDKPAPGKRGGRASNVPAIEQFLSQITVPGTYEMRSPDEDGGHPVNRIAQIRKAAGEGFKVETSPIESGKRYRVFVTLLPPVTE